MPLLQGMPLVNIVLAEIITEETTPKSYFWKTAEEAKVDPKVSAGKETILRVKNQIIAVDKTEDLVIGYDLNFKNNTLIPELLELIDGGVLLYDATDKTKVIGYEGPEAGKEVIRKKFTINVYTEEKDADGSTVKYAKFTYKHCKGKPIGFSLKDGQFYVPELKAESRPKGGEKPVKIDFIDKLPIVA